MSTFTSPPAPGSGIKWEDHKGALLLIEAKSFEPLVKTAYGESDAVKADIDVLDGPGKGETYPDCLIFPKLVLSQTKGSIGQKVLGRLSTGVAKPGQSAPWLLVDASADDTKLAEKWVAEHQPATTAPAPPF